MRSALVVLVALAGDARAETSLNTRAGLGIGRYSERAQGVRFESDLQPFLFAGAEGGIAAGTGAVVLGASAGLGTDVHMDAYAQGQLLQNNHFHQEIFDGIVRYRWPGKNSLVFDAGYRFTMQRLHFTGIEDPDGNPGPIPSATEVVTVHALEGAIGWRARREDGSRRHLMLGLGLNRGRAENNRIDDESFAASGIGVRIDAGHRWASGLTVDGVVAWRQQSGSDVENVTVSGMETQAVWPKNTTWVVGVAAGYAL